MFYSCSNLRNLDLHTFNLVNTLNYTDVFKNCVNLTLTIDKENFGGLLDELPDDVSYVDYKKE